MKNLKNYLFACLSIASLAFACEEDGPEPVEIPFEATLYTSAGPNSLQEMCDESISQTNFWGKEHQVGEGTATELGNFTTELTFCIHIILDENGNPNPLAEGFGEYKDGEGYMEDEDGNRLFVSIPEGKVKPSTKPNYLLEFQDTMYITGGTGPYEGASGELVSDSYVDGDGTDHKWTGSIILIK